jgi:hypothetical protein
MAGKVPGENLARALLRNLSIRALILRERLNCTHTHTHDSVSRSSILRENHISRRHQDIQKDAKRDHHLHAYLQPHVMIRVEFFTATNHVSHAEARDRLRQRATTRLLNRCHT